MNKHFNQRVKNQQAKLKQKLVDNVAEVKAAFFDIKFYRTLFFVAVGSVLGAFSINSFLIPLQLISPGFAGLSIGIYYNFGWGSVPVIYLLLNVPLYLLGWRMISWRYLLINIIGTIIFTLALELVGEQAIAINDIYLKIIFGASIAALGAGLYLRYGGSVGGLDIVAFLIKKKLSVPMGTTFFLVNMLNLVLNYSVAGIDNTLYSAVYMFVFSFVVNATRTGFSQTTIVLIVSNKYREISTKLSHKLDRTFTYLRAVGGYSSKETNMIYIVVNQFELGRIKEIVYDIDPKSLLSVMDTKEVIGQSFLSWEDEGYSEHNKKNRNPVVLNEQSATISPEPTQNLGRNIEQEFTVDGSSKIMPEEKTTIEKKRRNSGYYRYRKHGRYQRKPHKKNTLPE